MGSVLHTLATLLVLALLVIAAYAGYYLWSNLNLGSGVACRFNFQCKSRACSSTAWGLIGGSCKGATPPGSLPADNKTECVLDASCAPGANGASVCGALAGSAANVCCASGATGTSPCGVTNYCNQLPPGTPCRNDGSCASGTCLQSAWCALGRCQ